MRLLLLAAVALSLAGRASLDDLYRQAEREARGAGPPAATTTGTTGRA